MKPWRSSIGMVQLAFGSAILTLLLVGAISYRAILLSVESNELVRHTHEVLENLQGLLLALDDLESSDRGFAMTGDHSFLEAYAASLATVRREQATVRYLTGDNPAQQQLLTRLDILVAQKIEFSGAIIASVQTDGTGAATRVIQSREGQRVMEHIQAAVRNMQNEELRLLIVRNDAAARHLGQTRALLCGGTIVGLIFTGGAGWRVQRDNVRRTTAEQRLRRGITEREVLLQEIHHRVKNNLQVISSLINMQVRQLDAGPSRDALQQFRTRVDAIALIHEQLYQSRDYAKVPFSEYAKTLVTNVVRAAQPASDDRIALEFDVSDLTVPVDKAIPCGLILNELITNALKHAFPNGQSGVIRLDLSSVAGGFIRIAVSDNGVGLPKGLDLSAAASLGWQLVRMLANQIGADVSVDTGSGTSVRLIIPVAISEGHFDATPVGVLGHPAELQALAV